MNARISRRIFAVLLAVAMLVPIAPRSLTAAPAEPAPLAAPAVEDAPSGEALSLFREGSVYVRVVAPESANLHKYGQFVARRIPDPATGMKVYYGFVDEEMLASLEANRYVVDVARIQVKAEAPDARPDPDVTTRTLPGSEELRARLTDLRDNPPAPTQRPETTGWWDVTAGGHNAAEAWDDGYEGTGVVVAVNDSGVDMAHPDFWGTEARYTNVLGHPYYDYFEGWPLALSPFSNYLMAFDLELNGQLTWSNTFFYRLTNFADTSTTGTGDTVVYQSQTYTTTGTAHAGNPVYHVGYHPDWSLGALWGERIGVLVVDENGDDVYDTVYVDLNNNKDFRDDKPARKDTYLANNYEQGADELSWWDADRDGYPDLSGGMLYFIADGAHCPPFFDVYFGCSTSPAGGYYDPPDNGDLVAFMFVNLYDTDHGQLCASTVVGQGNINGPSPSGDYPDWKPAAAGGMIQGPGRKAKVVPVGDIYWGFEQSVEQAWWFQALGLDGVLIDPDVPGGDDALQASSNSFGPWWVYEDGWDEWSRVPTYLNMLNPYTTFFMSSGNTGPGFGTTGAPQPITAIQLGGSSQYGSSGVYEPLASVDQITVGDTASYISRGPSANNQLVPHVMANGAWGTGALGLNEYGDGWTAWDTWGGTSRSSPLAMGVSTLVMDAYAQRTGAWPDWYEVRQALMQGANHIYSSPLDGGTGYVNAGRSANITGGGYGVVVSPDYWDVGDYEGVRYPGGFAHIAEPGEPYTTEVEIENVNASAAVTVTVSDYMLEEIGVYTHTFTTVDQSLEDGEFLKPDYLFDVEEIVGSALPGDTVLLAAEILHAADTFDVDGDENTDSYFRLNSYDWTDINGDGTLWEDVDGDGLVEYGEIDEYEYVRLNRAYDESHYQILTAGDPLNRVHDGLMLGIRHSVRSASVPTTTLTVRVTLYRQADWGALDTSGFGGSVVLSGGGVVTAAVPFVAPTDYGVYQGAIQVDVEPDGEEAYMTIVPVMVNVAYSGDLTAEPAALTFGDVDDADQVYSNGYVRPIQDRWQGRGTGGDWRFFFLNQETNPNGPGVQTKMVARTWWDADAPPADIDTFLLGPDYYFSSISNDPSPPFGSSYGVPSGFWGPHSLRITGRSESPFLGNGHWAFQTATGGNVDYAIGDLNRGLNGLQIHSQRYDGKTFRQDFEVQVGYVDAPEFLEWDNYATERVTLTTNLNFTDKITVTAFGLSPVSIAQESNQFAPGPSTYSYNACVATYHYTFTTSDLSQLTVVIDNFVDGDDLDLFVLYDYNGDGSFNCASEVIGNSGSGSPDPETVVISNPPDGLYQVAVDPYDVGTDGDYFDLFVTGLELGDTIQVSSLDVDSFGPGDPVSFDVSNKMGTCSDTTRECLGGFVQVWLDAAAGPRPLFDIPVSPHYNQVDLSQLSYKEVSDAVALPGDVLTYTIRVVNTADASGTVYVTDTLPNGVEFLDATSGYSYDPVGNRISWDIAMPAGGGKIVSAEYDWVDISGAGTPVGTGWFAGLYPSGDDEGVTWAALPFTYTFFGTEYGPGDGVYIDPNGQVMLPNGATNLTVLSDGQIPSPDGYDERIAVLFGDQWGPNTQSLLQGGLVYGEVFTYHDDNGTPADDSDDRFIIQWDEWQLSERVCRVTGAACDVPYPDNTYQLILYPDGSAKAQYAEINALPPIGFPSYGGVGDAGVEGPFGLEGYKWHLTPAAGMAWMYTPTVASEVVLTLTAQITDTLDDALLCNEAELDNGHGQVTLVGDCTIVEQADLTVGKSVSAPEALSNDVLTYTIFIDNGGPMSTTVILADVLPAGLTFGSFVTQPVGINESGGTVGGSTLVTASESVEVVFTVTVDPTTTQNLEIVNAVEVDNGYGLVYGDDAEVAINTTDLSGSDKAVSDGSALPGDVITYTITVDNSGNYTATVGVEDTLPSEVTFGGIVVPASGFSYGSGVLNGTVDVPPGMSVDVVFTVTVDDVADGTVIGNEAELDDGTSIEIVGPAQTTVDNVDLSGSSKAVDLATADVGDTLVYTITLSNAGGVDAAVAVTDELASVLTFGGFIAQPTGIYEMGGVVEGSTAVAAGADVEIVYTTTVNLVRSGTAVVNSAWIDDGMNAAFQANEVRTDLNGVDLMTLKMVSAETVSVGEQFAYTVVLSNSGVADATVTLTDPLPADVDFVSVLPATANYDGVDHLVTWSGVVTAGEQVELDILVEAVAASPDGSEIYNWARIEDGLGPGWWTNQVRTQIAGGELYVSKLVNDPIPDPGEAITYTIVVRNVGTAATTVNITDSLPSGVTYNPGTLAVVYGTGSTSDVGPLTGSATLQAGLVGNEVRFQFQATVDTGLEMAAEVIINTVTFVDEAGNTGSASATIIVAGSRVYMPLIFKNSP
jgi:uncharacterized repeat protein (TIGR01451 family)